MLGEDDDAVTPCHSDQCFLCCILRDSFDVAQSGTFSNTLQITAMNTDYDACAKQGRSFLSRGVDGLSFYYSHSFKILLMLVTPPFRTDSAMESI